MGIMEVEIVADVWDFDIVKHTMHDVGPIDVLLLNYNMFMLLLPNINLMATLNLLKFA